MPLSRECWSCLVVAAVCLTSTTTVATRARAVRPRARVSSARRVGPHAGPAPACAAAGEDLGRGARALARPLARLRVELREREARRGAVAHRARRGAAGAQCAGQLRAPVLHREHRDRSGRVRDALARHARGERHPVVERAQPARHLRRGHRRRERRRREVLVLRPPQDDRALRRQRHAQHAGRVARRRAQSRRSALGPRAARADADAPAVRPGHPARRGPARSRTSRPRAPQLITGDESLRQSREALGAALGSQVPLAAPGDLSLDDFEAAVARTCKLNDDLEHRPDVVAARLREEIAERGVHDAELMFSPFVTVGSQLSTANVAILAPLTTWSAQAVLTVPLYDGGVRYGAMKDSQAALEQARQALAAARISAVVSAAQAARGVSVYEESRKVAQEQRDLAARVDQRTRDSYARGAGTSLDLVISAQALRQADINLVLLEVQVGQARASAVLTNAECVY